MKGAAARLTVTLAFGLVAGLSTLQVRKPPFGPFTKYPSPIEAPFLFDQYPFPHHVPRVAGGLSFRFAMAHDVIHERYPRHGPEHYRERNRLTQAQQAQLSADDPKAFALADDLGAGLDRLGQSDEAARVIRAKLARQEARGLRGRELYTSYANLGTFLVHGSLSAARAGDLEARTRFREGVTFLRKAVAVNPEAHFGRERWQVAIAELLLAAMDRPELLATFDCLGNRLDRPFEKGDGSHTLEAIRAARPARSAFNPSYVQDGPLSAYFEPGTDPGDPSQWPLFHEARSYVTEVGAEEGWGNVAVPAHRTPVPFDEPMLGIIGMWRQGGGANPHFALAVGETMLRVGQRYLAWTAYERATAMADRFWPDVRLQERLRVHCQKRQQEIERSLKTKTPGSPSVFDPDGPRVNLPAPEETVERLRPAFERELAEGKEYQRAYQQYEKEKIAAGVPLLDAHFFDAFDATHEPIVSPIGPEEWMIAPRQEKLEAHLLREHVSWSLVVGGIAALLAAVLTRWI